MIYLLKKNVWIDITKTILRYSPIAASNILKEWKMAITSVGQGYELTESQQDYRTGMEITYGDRGISIKMENQDVSTITHIDI